MKRILCGVLMLCGAAGAVRAQEEIITDVLWPQIESYCTFLRAGRVFDYDDPASWVFVHFVFMPTREGGDETAFVGLHHQLRQLEELKRETSGNTETITYRAYGKPAYDVTVVLVEGEEGYESSAYTGTISVSGEAGTEAVEFHGDCGV